MTEFFILDTNVLINSALIPNSFTACRDPKDNKFLELAIVAKASSIITGNEDLPFLNSSRKIPILNSSDFLVRF